ncbi:MAG: DUF697 domain-containing protein [Balneolales bacterium]|nr:DUF697 domain-containing protein [Balneolales bacterium]
MSDKKKRRRLYESTPDDLQEVDGIKQDNTPGSQKYLAYEIVKKYSYAASGVSFIPIPFTDIITVNTVQYLLVRRLSKHYDVAFSKERVKSIVSGLLSAVVGASILYGPVTRAFTELSGLGWIMRSTVSLSVSGMITYAVGMVFVEHFESGGDLLNFDIKNAKPVFEEIYVNGKTNGFVPPVGA